MPGVYAKIDSILNLFKQQAYAQIIHKGLLVANLRNKPVKYSY